MLRVFENNDTKLQFIVQGNELYFKAKEVALALGYERPRDAIREHVSEKYQKRLDEVRGATSHRPLNEQPHSVFISEPGLYELIFSSKLPKAIKFRDWVFEEVLPALRKTGKYEIERRFGGPNKLVFKIENEFDLHKKVVDYIRRFYPQMLVTPGLGELQDSDGKRIKCWQKGYQRGQPDLLILNAHLRYRGLCVELKTPKGNGVLSEDQRRLLRRYEENGYKVMISSDYDVICREIAEYARGIRLPCRWCCKRFKSAQTLGTHLRIFHRYNEQG